MTKLTSSVFVLVSLNICVSIIKVAMKRKLDTGHYPFPSAGWRGMVSFPLKDEGGLPRVWLRRVLYAEKEQSLKVTASGLIPRVEWYLHAWAPAHTDNVILNLSLPLAHGTGQGTLHLHPSLFLSVKWLFEEYLAPRSCTMRWSIP